MRRAHKGPAAPLCLGLLLLGGGPAPRAEESEAPFLVRVKTTYQEYERVSEKFFKLYSENKVLLRNPIMIPFSIEDLTYFRNHTYSKILKCMLEK